jgi:branched-chain amino acid transport system permease protein
MMRVAAASTDTPVLRTRGLVKRFGGVLALDNVDFDLAPGRLCGLVGPNGSGKSTFLNAISGFFPPDTGEITIAGFDVAGWPVHRIARIGVGRTFQVPMLVDEFTALENIEMGLVAGESRSILKSLLYVPSIARRSMQRREQALAALALVGLPASSISNPVEKLPLGLKRTVEVGRAVAAVPTLVLLDEPAAGLNEVERNQLGQLLVRLRDAGLTVLVVEHNVPFIMGICDEVVLLESGRIVCRADLAEPLPERLTAYLNYSPDVATAHRVRG